MEEKKELIWRELKCPRCWSRVDCGKYNFFCPQCKITILFAEEEILKQEY